MRVRHRHLEKIEMMERPGREPLVLAVNVAGKTPTEAERAVDAKITELWVNGWRGYPPLAIIDVTGRVYEDSRGRRYVERNN